MLYWPERIKNLAHRLARDQISLANNLLDYCNLICICLDDLVMQTVQGQFKAVCDAELLVDFPQTVLYDLFGGSQLKCNFLVALAFRDASDDRRVLGREAQVCGRIYQRSFLCAVGFDNPVQRLVVNSGLSGSDAPHASH